MAVFTKTLVVDPPGGDAQYHTISDAIAALNGNGGVIIVEEGSYDINTTISVPSDVTLIGRGNVVLNVESDVIVMKNLNNDGTNNTNERISISGFIIHIILTSGTYTQRAIDMKKISNCHFENITITAMSSVATQTAGMYITGGGESYPSYGNVITGCKIQEFYYGLYLKGSGEAQANQDCYYTMVDSNYFTDNVTGIHLLYSPRNNITNNICTIEDLETGLSCITIGESNYNTIVGNELNNSHFTGMHLLRSAGCTIQGNAISNNQYDGIRLEGASGNNSEFNTIGGNSIYGNTENGIYIYQYAPYNTFTANTCHNNTGYGVKEDNSNNGNNVFIGNVSHGNGDDELYVLGTSVVGDNMTLPA